MNKKMVKKVFTLIFILLVMGFTYLLENDFKLPTLEEIKNINFREEVEPVINDTNNNSGELQIYYLDVGQADAILISNNNKYSLIDAGNNADGEKLVAFFQSLGITSFEYVIGTHAHEDHVGGMDDIINNFKIKHFYMPDVVTTTKTFEDIITALENNNMSFETPKIDSSFSFGDSKFKVLYVGDETEDLNDTSIILKLTYLNTSFLFTGDTTSKIEKLILNKDIKSDVLKVAHHGSSYSNSIDFLDKVNPDYAVISVGLNNDYYHPHKAVLNRLKRLNTQVFRTDKDGTILLTTDGNNISFKTMRTDTNGGS